MTSSKINYLEIIKDAWSFTWKHKRLWWLGILLSVGESGMSIVMNLPGREMKNFFVSIGNNPAFLTTAIAILLATGLLLLVLNILARGAVIKSIQHASSTRTPSIKESLREGKKYFWKVLSIKFFIGTFVVFTLLVILLPVIFLFYHHQYAIGAILSFLAIIVVIPLVFLASFLEIYGLLYLLLGELTVWSSLEQAYLLLKNNLRTSILMSLVMLLLNLTLGIIMITALLPLILILIFISLFLIAILQKIGIALSIMLGLVSLVVPFILLRSVYVVLNQSAWIFFFGKIAKPKEEQTYEIITEKELKIKPAPGADAVEGM